MKATVAVIFAAWIWYAATLSTTDIRKAHNFACRALGGQVGNVVTACHF